MRLTTATVSALKLDTGVTDKIVFDDALRASACAYAPAGPGRGYISTKLEAGPGELSLGTPRRLN